LLLIDSAIKGAVLLLFATGVMFFLRRDSAATRHQVWLVAIVAMLMVPPLSAWLPQWRVLPQWASIVDTRLETRTIESQHANQGVTEFNVSSPQLLEGINRTASDPILRDFPEQDPPMDAAYHSLPIEVLETFVEPKQTIETWKQAVVTVWLIGFSMLILRLIAARVFLFRTECNAIVLPIDNPTLQRKTDCNLSVAFATACKTLNIQKPITLLIHPDKTTPAVWGVFRPRLMLPESAEDWSDDQLQSVLLHELAHIKRCDLLGQLAAQLACALHWFNLLVWYANWRLHVERERACDDLVLASGVRASAYAEHLLSVTTKLTTSRWTHACGLAMARTSSLHGRLSAVLSEKENRRSMTTTLLVASFVLSVGIAIPLAMLRAANEPLTITNSYEGRGDSDADTNAQNPKDGDDVKSPANSPAVRTNCHRTSKRCSTGVNPLTGFVER
jgi:beta-lactamase regulating signal transducer with metallopeptidase domain